MKIAVFDSGLGGLSVLSHLQREFPSCEYFYLGDTARTPYGTRSKGVVERYAIECVEFLSQFEPYVLVVACNTVSAVALEALSSRFKLPIFGMIEPVVDFAISHLNPKTVCILGTPLTVESGLYQSAIEKRDGSIKIKAISCPLFVPLVENGLFDGEVVEKVTDLYLGDYVKAETPDCLILGCTHYPFLKGSLARYFGDATRMVECAEGVVSALRALQEVEDRPDLNNKPLAPKGPAKTHFFVTDDIGRFNALSKQVLENWGAAELVQLVRD